MSIKQENMESAHTSLSQLQQKSQALAQQVAQEIVKTFGDWELATEYGMRLRFETGYKQSTISLDSLTSDGLEQTIRFSFTDIATGVNWSGEMPLQLICDVLEEQRRLENEK